MKRLVEKEKAKFLSGLVAAVITILAAGAFPAPAEEESSLNLQDVADRMEPATLQRVGTMIVEPLEERFPDRWVVTVRLGQPNKEEITEHRSIHDPDYVFQQVVLLYEKSSVTFLVFPDREMLSAFAGLPEDAGISALATGLPAGDVESILGESVRRAQDMLYTDGEWWLVRLVLDEEERLKRLEVYLFFN